MKRTLKLLACTLAVVLTSANAFSQVIYPSAEGWTKAKPEEMGYSQEKLDQIKTAISNKTFGTGACIIVGGKMIFEFGYLDRLSYIASCRKSVLSMMYGKYVENGTIDLNKTVADLGLDDLQGLTAQEMEATVNDLITARSGIYHPASNAGDSKDKPERGTYKRGEHYLYNNWDFNAAGEAFEIMTGKNIYDAFGEDIAGPINMQDWSRDSQKKTGDLTVSRFPAYHFHFSTRDMARIGYLMLRNGKWEDKQVISPEWIRKTTAVVSTYDEVQKSERFSYGYMWWLFDESAPKFQSEYKGAYTAWGAMGQYITIIPELDMVVAFKTDRLYGRKTKPEAYFEILDMIISAQL
jgi:CubicO group peptidase (beta-lactamase class C family)